MPIEGPSAAAECICIYTLNMYDGVGDTACALKVAQELEKIKEKHNLPLIGIIEIEMHSPLQSVLSLIQYKMSLFDKVFLLCDDPKLKDMILPDRVYTTSRFKPQESDLLKESLRSSKLYIEIYINYADKPGAKFDAYLDANTPRICLSELGLKTPPSPCSYNLGFVENSGIWVDEHPEETVLERAQKLLSFNNKDYIKVLLNKEVPSLDDATHFLGTHHFMPGYIQSKYQALFFILSHALRYCNDNGNLMENCDFHVRVKTGDAILIKFILSKVGIFNTEIVSPGYSPSTDQDQRPKVRIITGFYLDNDDFEKLFLISSDGAACSGDNSFLQVMSSHHPVFITGYAGDFGSNQFIKYFAQRQFFKELSRYLPDYAEAMSECSYVSGMSPHLRERTRDLETIQIQSKKAAEAMRDPNFMSDWKAFRTHIHTKYNFTKQFPKIIQDSFPGVELSEIQQKKQRP